MKHSEKSKKRPFSLNSLFRCLLSRCILLLGIGIIMTQSNAFAEDAAAGKQVAQKFTLKTDAGELTLDYWVYLPKDYQADGKKVPLMLFLHGAGERGNNLEVVKVHGPPMMVSKNQHLPCIVISPQCPKGMWWDGKEKELIGLLDFAEKKWNVDVTREYVTGLSMGGYGSWFLAAKQPDRFAAIVPICGGGDPSTAKKLASTPIWAFHGTKDRAVPIQQSVMMVDVVREAGGTAGLTVYPDVGHASWKPAYADPNLFQWMFSKKRSPKM